MSLCLGGRLLLLLLAVPGVWSRGHWGGYRVYSKPKAGNRASGSHSDSANQCWRELQSPRPCRVITATGKTVDIPDKDKDTCEDCSWGPRTCNGKGGAFNVYFCNTYEPLVSVVSLSWDDDTWYRVPKWCTTICTLRTQPKLKAGCYQCMVFGNGD